MSSFKHKTILASMVLLSSLYGSVQANSASAANQPPVFTAEEGKKIGEKIEEFIKSDKLKPFVQMQSEEWNFTPNAYDKTNKVILGEMKGAHQAYTIAFSVKVDPLNEWSVTVVYIADKPFPIPLFIDMMPKVIEGAKIKEKEQNLKGLPQNVYIKNKDFQTESQSKIEVIFFNNVHQISVPVVLTPDGQGGTFISIESKPN